MTVENPEKAGTDMVASPGSIRASAKICFMVSAAWVLESLTEVE
jgi:hypothetical protein